MSASWIKMNNALWSHPKVVLMACRLKVPKAHIIGMLHGAWVLADEHSDARGKVTNLTCEMIDAVVNFPGFAAQMQNVKWLRLLKNGVMFVDYEAHNGPTAKRRALENKRKAAVRSVAKEGDACPHPVRIDADGMRIEKSREDESREEERRPESSPRNETRQSNQLEISWEEVIDEAGQLNKTLKFAIYDAATTTLTADGRLLLQAVYCKHRWLSGNWLQDSVNAVEAARTSRKLPERKRAAYLTTCLTTKAEEAGLNFKQLRTLVTIPKSLLKFSSGGDKTEAQP